MEEPDGAPVAPRASAWEGAGPSDPSAVRLLVLSNGQGEDAIGSALAGAVAAHAPFPLRIAGWPMVGRGAAYLRRGIPVIGPPNLLPSEGFGTLSARAFGRDLRAGWLPVHWRQLRGAIALRGAFDFAIAVGDIVPLAAARASRLPFAFVGCAKSAYYAGGTGYTALERRFMRQAVACYPRDARTAQALARRGVRTRDLGNPMMDGWGDVGRAIDLRDGEGVVACLPGSRGDRELNAATILGMIVHERARFASAGLAHFAFALPPDFDRQRLHALLAASSGATVAWESDMTGAHDEPATLRCGALRATLAYNALGAVLARARVAIGLAGTANEQAVGAGVPVVTFATEGVQGDSYLQMKMPFFGESAMRVARDPAAVADAVLRVAGDDELHARMVAAGRERMGAPGATAAIAADIVLHLRRTGGA